ncbi:MAG: hypothetical protein ABF508_09030 [Zymomonas mobilis]|uniref:hypothetical protein n=1 Tax=Zymomonas mobilis TaxID=542 RepID=UPI0039E8C6D6
MDELEFRERIENRQEKLDDKGTGFAAYSGMRLEEIDTLRKEDLQTVDGTSCSLIRPHTETGWVSKTEAGTRMMQVHSKLIEAGLLALKETTDGLYLVPGLETSKQGASHKNTTYLTGITTANLSQTVETISYPETAFANMTI